MRLASRNSYVAVAIGCAAFASLFFSTRLTAADDAKAVDVSESLRRNISTQVVTLKIEGQRGEPREIKGLAQFDRNVDAYWINVVGVDVKFARTTEKEINRQLFAVDPFAKVINGRTVEVTGKLGIRDGSGDWDDTYEGTITVTVTAIMANP